MSQNQLNSSSQPAKRQVIVDGIRFSLDTGKPIAPVSLASTVKIKRLTTLDKLKNRRHRAQVPEKPLPKAVQLTTHHQAIMHPDPNLKSAELLHPHHVSHPSLPLPTRRQHNQPEYRTIWKSIIKPTLLNPPDSRTVKAGIIATLFSPFIWILAALPVVFILAIDIPERPIGSLYQASVSAVLRVNPSSLLIILSLSALAGCAVWLIRHLLLLVSYGIHIRRIDHRLASGRQLLWLASSKVMRFIGLALTDLVINLAIIIGGVYAITKIILAHGPLESMLVNLVILFIGIFLWLMATERPLSRVMLAATDQPLSSLVTKSFGLIIFSRGRALASGLVWLLIAGVHAAALVGIVWASSAYGLLQVTSVLGRIILLLLSSSLILVVASIFTIWSHDFWSHVYHDLAHRSHHHDISSLITGSNLTKSRKRIIVSLASLGAILLIMIGLSIYFVRTPLTQGLN
ncbi:hypothetical protein KBC99_01005, partial [Candidatus Saccharibacteria bacterium]|nr:hypothetical protein [Candidatus Saccharibacteria bacterium]